MKYKCFYLGNLCFLLVMLFLCHTSHDEIIRTLYSMPSSMFCFFIMILMILNENIMLIESIRPLSILHDMIIPRVGQEGLKKETQYTLIKTLFFYILISQMLLLFFFKELNLKTGIQDVFSKIVVLLIGQRLIEHRYLYIVLLLISLSLRILLMSKLT